MQGLQVSIHPVTGITHAVIGQCENFGLRHHPAGKFRACIISARAIFIDIIAHMQHRINIIALRCVAIGVEITIAQIGAGKDGEVEFFRFTGGQGFGFANRRN